MKERFQGEAGLDRLTETLRRQIIVQGNHDIARRIAVNSSLIEFKNGDFLITEGKDDNHILLIIHGCVDILINGRKIAERKSKEHIGEMAMIDPSALRSANVVATEYTLCAKVDEEDFIAIANDYPDIWRQIALELSERIRQRKFQIDPTNSKPIVFIGSSVESLKVARLIKDDMSYDNVVVRLWSDGGVFGVSEPAIDDLSTQVKDADFAILVLGTDDTVVSRGEETDAPRDNVVFELGLFMGSLGRTRVFMVKPRGLDVKIPSDLMGINPVDYVSEPDEDLEHNIGAAVNAIRKKIELLGPK